MGVGDRGPGHAVRCGAVTKKGGCVTGGAAVHARDANSSACTTDNLRGAGFPVLHPHGGAVAVRALRIVPAGGTNPVSADSYGEELGGSFDDEIGGVGKTRDLPLLSLWRRGVSRVGIGCFVEFAVAVVCVVETTRRAVLCVVVGGQVRHRVVAWWCVCAVRVTDTSGGS